MACLNYRDAQFVSLLLEDVVVLLTSYHRDLHNALGQFVVECEAAQSEAKVVCWISVDFISWL